MVVAEPPGVAGHRLRVLNESDAAALDALGLRCASFYQLVAGRTPQAGFGVELVTELPPGRSADDKVVFGVLAGGDAGLVGVVDIVRGYPQADVWWIGLLLLDPSVRGQGLGASIVTAIRHWVHARGGRAIRLGVQAQNEGGRRFWLREGFAQVDTVERTLGDLTGAVLVMEAVLRP